MAVKLKAKVWVQAQVRLCDIAGLPITVPRKGDPDAGQIILKLNRLAGGCVVLTQTRTPDGTLAWMRSTGAEPVPEGDADDYIERQVSFDPDLWIVEIEDPDDRYEPDAPVVEL